MVMRAAPLLFRLLPACCRLAGAVAVLAAGLAPAGADTQAADPVPGYRVALPASYVVTPSQHPQNDKVLAIRSKTGMPRAANTDGTLCSAAFRQAPQNARLSQSAINRHLNGEAFRGVMRTTVGAAFTIERETPFTDSGVAGIEIIGTPKHGPGAAGTRIILAIAETPKGRSTLSCAVPASDLATALEALRAIRKAITIPK